MNYFIRIENIFALIDQIKGCFGCWRNILLAAILIAVQFVNIASSLAADTGSDSGADSDVNSDPQNRHEYISTGPSYIVNFRGRRLRFMRADVSVRVDSVISKQAVERNLPLIQDAIITFLTAQNETIVENVEKRSDLRMTMRENVQSAIQIEVPEAKIVDLLLTNFFVE